MPSQLVRGSWFISRFDTFLFCLLSYCLGLCYYFLLMCRYIPRVYSPACNLNELNLQVHFRKLIFPYSNILGIASHIQGNMDVVALERVTNSINGCVEALFSFFF